MSDPTPTSVDSLQQSSVPPRQEVRDKSRKGNRLSKVASVPVFSKRGRSSQCVENLNYLYSQPGTNSGHGNKEIIEEKLFPSILAWAIVDK